MRRLWFMLVALIAAGAGPRNLSADIIFNGGVPDPVLVEIRSSLRLSFDLEADLTDLAAVEAQLGMEVEKRFVGSKYVELVAFPPGFTDDQVYAAIATLTAQPQVERVTMTCAAFGIYQPVDFSVVYEPNDIITEAVKRGLATPPPAPFDPLMLSAPHVRGEFVVAWKPEFVWNAADRISPNDGELQRCAQLHRDRDALPIRHGVNAVAVFGWRRQSTGRILATYVESGLVRYVQPNILGSIAGNPPGEHKHKHKRK